MAKGDELPESAVRRAAEASGDEVVRCRRCGHPIARASDAIDVDGAHVHLFVNPAALEFRIGCYREAGGCKPWGDAESFWSWFPGFAWRMGSCKQCGVHVGWAYERIADGSASGFFGIILDRVAT
jgi:hypothetical protein